MHVEQVYAVMDVDNHLKALASTEENAKRWLIDQGWKPADVIGFPGCWYKGIDYYKIVPQILWR